jgi:hypothetical protein
MLIIITVVLFIAGTLILVFTDYQFTGAIICLIGLTTILRYNLHYALVKWIQDKWKK